MYSFVEDDLSARTEKGSLGMLLLQLLRERSDGTLNFEDGAVYPLLHTFERDGLAEGYWESNEADARHKGARRRYYRLTPKGLQALRTALEEWRQFTDAVGRVVGDPARAGEQGGRS